MVIAPHTKNLLGMKRGGRRYKKKSLPFGAYFQDSKRQEDVKEHTLWGDLSGGFALRVLEF